MIDLYISLPSYNAFSFFHSMTERFLHVGYNSTLPQDIPFCRNEPLPTAFSVTCQNNSTFLLPVWLVTGLATMSDLTIVSTMPMPHFFSQSEVMGQLGITVSNLNVTSPDVREGTCFQCEIATSSGVFRSKQGCVTAVGEWNAAFLLFFFNVLCSVAEGACVDRACGTCPM